MITLNDLALPSPAALSVRSAWQAGTAQYNTLGLLVQDGMREKRTVEITWARMDTDTLAALAALLRTGGFMTLVYPDPLSGQRSMRCRAVSHSERLWRYEEGAPRWADVKLILEEQ